MRYAVACDHAGLPLKREIVDELRSRGHEVLDLGTNTDASVDYPVYAADVARAIQQGRADRGVLTCGTGVGMSVTANKFRGIRAACVADSYSARMARRHTDANVLCMGARVLGPGAALEVLRAWLAEEFEGGRHANRVNMIGSISECG